MKHILHIDDNEGDIILTQEAFNAQEVAVAVTVAYNGEEGLAYLSSCEKYPDLILLDINMPIMNGKEFLAIIKNHEIFKSIPVVMLTTSESPLDVQDCYRLNANAYLNKTLDFDSYLVKIASIINFWLTHNININNTLYLD